MKAGQRLFEVRPSQGDASGMGILMRLRLHGFCCLDDPGQVLPVRPSRLMSTPVWRSLTAVAIASKLSGRRRLQLG